MSIYAKLQIVQERLNAPKNQFNAFGKYNYRNCEDILEALKPLLKEVGAVLIITDELVVMGERYYIKSVVYFIDCEDGTKVYNAAFAREEDSKKGMDASQVTGSTSSYARKYALNGLFCIDDVKDSDTTNNSDSATKNSKGKPKQMEETKITNEQIIILRREMKEVKLEDEKILSSFNLKKLEDMNISQYESCLRRINLTKEKNDNQKGA